MKKGLNTKQPMKQETGMGRYAEKIMQELDRREAACIYESREQLVRTCQIYRYGELWGVYRYEYPEIICLMSFSLGVPEDKAVKVQEYLSSVNPSIDGGFFYMDHRRENIVFRSVYDTSTAEAGPETGAFTAFCHLPCDMFLEHQEALYDIVSL